MMNSTSASSCTIDKFPAYLFGGSADGTTDNVYAQQSDNAHFILGIHLAVLVLNWACYVCEYMYVKRAYLIGGVLQFSMGLYLISWNFIWMHLADLSALYHYSTNDLLQLQHIAIASLLMSTGIIDILQALFLLRHEYFVSLWNINLSLVGMIFLSHQQKNYSATIKHFMLGLSIVCASILFARAKTNLLVEMYIHKYCDLLQHHSKITKNKGKTARKYTKISNLDDSSSPYPGDFQRNVPKLPPLSPTADNIEFIVRYRLQTEKNWTVESFSPNTDYNLLFAGCFFSMASVLLILFHETSTGIHYGHSIHCQAGYPLVIIAYVLAFASVFIACCVIFLHSSRGRSLINACCPRMKEYLALDEGEEAAKDEEEEQLAELQLSGKELSENGTAKHNSASAEEQVELDCSEL
jgi:hypothetical protein